MSPALAYDRSLRHKDADGRLHVQQCNISKATVNPYFGREIPNAEALGLDPERIYWLYRDPQELAKGASTFDNLPLLVKHVPVSAEAPERELVVGTIGSDAVFEYPYLKASLAVWTQEGIDLVESGEQEQLSSAYRYTPDMRPGVSPEGLRFDGVMRNIIGNHVAIVLQGRAGPDVVVADANPLELPKMRSSFLAKFIALFAPTATAEQVIALDAALAADLAQDGKDDELNDEEKTAACDAMAKSLGKALDELSDEEKEAAYARAAADKAAKDETEPGTPKPGVGLDADAVAAAVAAAKAEGVAEGIAQAQATAVKLAADTKLASDALAAARAEVAPLCGEVTCDSAVEVFAFALKHMAIDTDGVDPSAYPALFRVAAKITAAPVVKPIPAVVAADSRAVFPIITSVRKG